MSKTIGDSTLVDVWATEGNIVTPTEATITQGWLKGQEPPHSTMNWLQNIFGEKLNQILFYGTPLWNSTTAYSAKSFVNYGSHIYLSLRNNNMNNTPPLNASNDYWKLLSFVGDWVVDTITNSDTQIPSTKAITTYVPQLNKANAYTGVNTFSGKTVFQGDIQLSGNNTFNNGVFTSTTTATIYINKITNEWISCTKPGSGGANLISDSANSGGVLELLSENETSLKLYLKGNGEEVRLVFTPPADPVTTYGLIFDKSTIKFNGQPLTSVSLHTGYTQDINSLLEVNTQPIITPPEFTLYTNGDFVYSQLIANESGENRKYVVTIPFIAQNLLSVSIQVTPVGSVDKFEHVASIESTTSCRVVVDTPVNYIVKIIGNCGYENYVNGTHINKDCDLRDDTGTYIDLYADWCSQMGQSIVTTQIYYDITNGSPKGFRSNETSPDLTKYTYIRPPVINYLQTLKFNGTAWVIGFSEELAKSEAVRKLNYESTLNMDDILMFATPARRMTYNLLDTDLDNAVGLIEDQYNEKISNIKNIKTIDDFRNIAWETVPPSNTGVSVSTSNIVKIW